VVRMSVPRAKFDLLTSVVGFAIVFHKAHDDPQPFLYR
jgi:hypothetical protein